MIEVSRRAFLGFALLQARGSVDIRIALRGEGPGRRGADLAVEEMTATALLLGQRVTMDPGAEVVADAASGTLVAGPQSFFITASAGARRAALDAWRAGEGDGVPHAAVEWHPHLTRFGAEQLNQRYARRFDTRMDAAAWVGWMLVKVIVDARLRSVAVETGRYDGHKGVALVFGPDRHLLQPLCIIDSGGALLGTTR